MEPSPGTVDLASLAPPLRALVEGQQAAVEALRAENAALTERNRRLQQQGPEIEGGLPTEGMLAHVLVSKFADHLPLYRQAQIYARSGVDPRLRGDRLCTARPWPTGSARRRSICGPCTSA